MNGADARVLGLLQDARQKLELERERRTAPIAIIGIGCRFPGGASSPDAYWELLERGVDATSDVPADRWDAAALYDADPAAPGKIYVKRGGFLPSIDGFDPSFFGISPREAAGMDPQQRLLLEVAWEALEDAGIVPERLRGSATGVWIGLCLDDYSHRSIASGELSRIDPYTALGSTRSIAAGRISYVLDLRGPAVQLDTSCSSSLVAVHQACQSLRSGETDLALVGGVNLMSSPASMVALCKLRALAPDGRCKTFDASADGYGRGEGCGIVVLKRLRDALADGDHVHAVVRGIAGNHDGRSNGLTAPNGLAQEAVIRSALANAGASAADVSYVEAHGTGTLLGDPIEVFALARTYGRERDVSSPLHLGSVKTNFGHLEGAAGVAGLIKVALCLSRGKLAPHLHLREPNPKIPWADLPVRVVTELLDWPSAPAPRMAGLSSFGLSGTNAHAILAEPPRAPEKPASPPRARELVVLSARTDEALDGYAARLLEHVDAHPELTLGELAYNLAATRSAFERRLAVVVSDRAELCVALSSAAAGGVPKAGVRRQAPAARPKACWLFTGQGAQRSGMGRQLYAEWPAFQKALDAALDALAPHLPRPLANVMWAEPGSPDAALLDQTGYTQPALFALEWALAALWRSFGVEPDLLLGHSIGEIAAACVAEVFSLEEAARLVCARGRLMQALPEGGAMWSIGASEDEVASAAAEHAAFVSIAAVNGPRSVVISGERARVSAIAQRFAARGVTAKPLVVSHAFHSPLMDPMLAEYRRIVDTIQFRPAKLSLISGASGALDDSRLTTPEYWVAQVRNPVRFCSAVEAALRAGARTFVELGPKATLLGLVPECAPGEAVQLLASIEARRPEPEAVLEALGAWFAENGIVDWAGVFPAGLRRTPLPTYAWQRQHFWLDDAAPRERLRASTQSGAARALHSEASAEDIRFALRWQPAESRSPNVSLPERASLPERWRVIAFDESPLARELALELSSRGAEVQSALPNDIASVRNGEHVVCAWPALDGSAAALNAASQGLTLVRALIAKGYTGRLWWLTERAVCTSNAMAVHAAGAALWGLGRTVMQEHPELGCSLLDVDATEHIAGALLLESAAQDGEAQSAWHGGQRFVPRLQRLPPATGSDPPRLWRPGTVLITGGGGALGGVIARDLARQGVRHFLLVNRRGQAAPGASETRDALEAMGAKVTFVAADVADRRALQSALSALPEELPLRAVIHAAGVLHDAALRDQTLEHLVSVMTPKVQGAVNLDELTRDADLDAFIMFSSLAGTLGSAGQGPYAAANAFLDALCAERASRGLPALSIAWGPWSERGLAADLQASFARRGVLGLSSESGARGFAAARAQRASSIVIAAFDLAALSRTFAGAVPGVWRALLSAGAAATDERGPLTALPPEQRIPLIAAALRAEAARVLSLPDAASIPTDKSLADMGLDSLMAVELRSALGRRTGVFLPASILDERPTLAAIERYLVTHASAPTATDAAAPQASPIAPAETTLARCHVLRALASPRLRLFCFHDAGGSSELFAPFIALESAGVEVHVISHTRSQVPSETSSVEYLRQATTYVRGLANQPYALFGHSLGGLFAWRVACELAGQPRAPAVLAVSAIDPAGRDPSSIDRDLHATFARIFGDRAASAPHLEQDFMTDMQLWHALSSRAPRPQTLTIPIAAFAGRTDHVAPEAAMQGWSTATASDFSLNVLPGNHFYLTEARPRRSFMTALTAALSAPPSAPAGADGDRMLSTTQYW